MAMQNEDQIPAPAPEQPADKPPAEPQPDPAESEEPPPEGRYLPKHSDREE